MFEGLFRYAFLILIVVVGGYLAIGFIVDRAVPYIPPSMEMKIFGSAGMAPEAAGPAANANDPNAGRLKGILAKLTANPEVLPLEYTLFTIDDKSPNAVAMPGGGIGVTTGLTSALGEEIGLAFVLGHELGHFKQRDHLRGVGRIVGIRIILGLVFGDSDILNFLTARATDLLHKKYSRGQEEGADRFGLKLVYDTYGDVNGTTRLFEILSKNDSSPKWAYMLSTHPAPESRVRKMKEYAVELKAERKQLPAGDKTRSDW